MKGNNIYVFDTNALVSATLIKNSVNAKALDLAIETGLIAISSQLLLEFSTVLMRPKLDSYFKTIEERFEPIKKLERHGKLFKPIISIKAALDVNDNFILELAVEANATAIITGDKQLLSLDPFDGIPIINATLFLQRFEK